MWKCYLVCTTYKYMFRCLLWTTHSAFTAGNSYLYRIVREKVEKLFPLQMPSSRTSHKRKLNSAFWGPGKPGHCGMRFPLREFQRLRWDSSATTCCEYFCRIHFAVEGWIHTVIGHKPPQIALGRWKSGSPLLLIEVYPSKQLISIEAHWTHVRNVYS